uniref:Uncharacterized protein n=1 Tax=Siphoviridae sp. ctGQT3 TaxID=2825412 RepID=A0A8S5UED8_9CAUD|nr:MAG TPA: hypothetical protein [Siphoviridae sp. ctGQT3]
MLKLILLYAIFCAFLLPICTHTLGTISPKTF